MSHPFDQDPQGDQQPGDQRPGDQPGTGHWSASQPAGDQPYQDHPAEQFPSSQPTAPYPNNGPVDWMPPDIHRQQTPAEPTTVLPVIPAPAPPQRRRRPVLVVGIVVVAVLAVLLAADRITPVVLGRSVGSDLQQDLGTKTAPQVHFDGFPFLNQLATKHFGEVEVTAHDVSSQQQAGEINVRTVTANLHDVDVSDDQIAIGSADGSALLEYPAVSTLVGHTVSFAGDNKIKINLLSEIAITASLGVDQQQQKVVLNDVAVDGANTPGFANDLVERLVNTLMPALSLPTGIQLTGLQVSEDGVWAQGTGRNLTVPR